MAKDIIVAERPKRPDEQLTVPAPAQADARPTGKYRSAYEDEAFEYLRGCGWEQCGYPPGRKQTTFSGKAGARHCGDGRTNW